MSAKRVRLFSRGRMMFVVLFGFAAFLCGYLIGRSSFLPKILGLLLMIEVGQHLFGSIVTVLDPGSGPTDKDLERIDLIDRELRDFINDFSMRRLPTEGRA